jgi:hypothetical protein
MRIHNILEIHWRENSSPLPVALLGAVIPMALVKRLCGLPRPALLRGRIVFATPDAPLSSDHCWGNSNAAPPGREPTGRITGTLLTRTQAGSSLP